MKNISTSAAFLVLATMFTGCGEKSEQNSPKLQTQPPPISTETTPDNATQSSSIANQLWKNVEALAIPSLAEHTFKPARVGEFEVCGVDAYNTGTSKVCGVQLHFAKRTPACTIAQTITHDTRVRAPQCGAERYEQRASPVCGSDSVTEWSSWGTWSCKQGSSVETQWRSTWSGPEPRQLCRTTRPRTCEHPSFPVVAWKECVVNSTQEIIYDSCRDPSHGDESYFSCADSSFGIAKFNKCEITKTEAESAAYAKLAQNSAEVASLKLMTAALRIHATNKNETAMKCVVSFAEHKTSIDNVENIKKAFEEITQKTSHKKESSRLNNISKRNITQPTSTS
jgi:hypothetical protein